MHSKLIRILLAVTAFSALLVTRTYAEDPKVTCPGPTCTCKTVKVHECEAKSDGTIYNCRDVNEMQCTITSGPGSGKDFKIHK